jgi:hypothetical protein
LGLSFEAARVAIRLEPAEAGAPAREMSETKKILFVLMVFGAIVISIIVAQASPRERDRLLLPSAGSGR